MSDQHFTVCLRKEDESFDEFVSRIRTSKGQLLVALSPDDERLLKADTQAKWGFFAMCDDLRDRLHVSLKSFLLMRDAKRRSLRVLHGMSALRVFLTDHPQADEIVRHSSPNEWRQQLRTRLQSVGLLSMPRLRIWALIVTSVFLFLFVIFRLLPSAEVRIWPRQEGVSQTMNVYLAQSGAEIPAPTTVHRSPLLPLQVEVQKSITFDQIHREFTGRSAVTNMQVFNTSNEEVSLREGSRLKSSSGGLIFRLRDEVIIAPKSSATVFAVADDHDLLGAIIGDRGNVPVGLRWDFPGLDEDDQKMIYAKNITAGRGGTTSSRLVLRETDLKLAEKQLHRELIATAKDMIRDKLALLNQQHADYAYEAFDDPALITAIFHDVHLPQEFIGEAMASVPVEGSVTYTVHAYDANKILTMLSKDLNLHIETGKQLMQESLSLPSLKVFVIKWDDGLSWIKVTAELIASERYVLDPLTPEGAQFGHRMRDAIAGLPYDEALRVIKNMPEVERAELSLWPPWSRALTSIPGNITVQHN